MKEGNQRRQSPRRTCVSEWIPGEQQVFGLGPAVPSSRRCHGRPTSKGSATGPCARPTRGGKKSCKAGHCLGIGALLDGCFGARTAFCQWTHRPVDRAWTLTRMPPPGNRNVSRALQGGLVFPKTRMEVG